MQGNDQQTTQANGRLDLEAVRQKLAGTSGRRYWRTLEEVADTPEFQKWIDDEFPNRSSISQMNRRDLLKFMGASMALAGLSGCRGMFLPQEKLIPYVKQPEELVPGKPLYYATSVSLAGYATGVLVEQHEGRPTKLEGNPDHPASLGAIDAISQAELLNLYDPDRIQNVTFRGDVSTWELLNTELAKALTEAAKANPAGIKILTGAVTSPTLLAQVEAFLEKYPGSSWHAHEAVGRTSSHEGTRAVFGRPLDPVYDFTEAKTILTLDADFLATSMPGSLRYARQFMDGRRVTGKTGSMNRLYSVESGVTLCGAVADHRWAVKSSLIPQIANSIAGSTGAYGSPSPSSVAIPGLPQAAFDAMVSDLQANQGLVIPGEYQPAEVHALAHAINAKIGALASGAVRYIEPVDATVTHAAVGSLSDLVTDLNGGNVQVLVIVGGNPVYDAPADFGFDKALARAKLKIHHSQHANETSAHCEWVAPATHSLEEWGDARAFDGTYNVVQPLIAPLFDGRSAIEFLAQLASSSSAAATIVDKSQKGLIPKARQPLGGYDLVRGTWQKRLSGEFEREWRIVVHDGLVAGSAAPAVAVTPSALASLNIAGPGTGTEIIFRPDPSIYDGRFANNGWLQELPKPLTKVTWDNVAIMSPKTAEKLNTVSDDVVSLSLNGQSVDAGVFVLPGQAEDTVLIHLGYGRTRGGVVATVTGEFGGGCNVYALRTSKAPWHQSGVDVKNTGKVAAVASTQGHAPINDLTVKQFEWDEREIILDYSLPFFEANVDRLVEERKKKSDEIRAQNQYPDQIFDWKGEQWAMTVDLNTCIGCNACVAACVAENNIPVVGKVQVERHREMHWIRIDRYFGGGMDAPTINWQPVMCVHCEKAPCEPVCPVAATVHSHDGLNQMIYNRCVGTRYCSNNCPYKVRHFNFLNYTDNQIQFSGPTEPGQAAAIQDQTGPPLDQRRDLLKLINNPNVTVRGRGVMEKCSYCVQRINDARIEAKKANTPIKDGQILTACQQACPTNTIVFGDQNDPESKVHALRNDPRAYLLLEELQTRPRTSHLAKLRNPNPAITPISGPEGAK